MMQGSERRFIVYAEDDTDDQDIMKEMIGKIDENLEVVIANNGLELIQFLAGMQTDEFYPCFIILDVNMPVWDGVRTLEALKADWRYMHIPVIMFSTSNMKRDIDLAARLGAEQFITKPLKEQETQEVTRKFAAYCKQFTLSKKQVHA